MIPTDTPNTEMNTKTMDTPFQFTFDKLSLCYTDPNMDHVNQTVGSLLSEKYQNAVAGPGFKITTNQRYKVSARIPFPIGDCVSKHIVVLEAGPYHPGVSSYRLEFNPSKITKAGLIDLLAFLDCVMDEHSQVFFLMGKVTRCDLAIDFPSLDVRDVIIRTARLQKHGVYTDRYGFPETLYVGTPRSRRMVAYQKPDEHGSHLRLECRLKPGCLGKDVATLPNPFAKVQLIPADFSGTSGLPIPAQFIADSMRIGGLKRALAPLTNDQRKILRHAYANALELVPNLDALWATWPDALVEYGLGAYLGALPVTLMKQVGFAPLLPACPEAI
jgi:hypothetical protein